VGGAENQLIMLCGELAGRGFRLQVLCLRNRGSQSGKLEARGIEVRALPERVANMRGLPGKLLRLIVGIKAVVQRVRRFEPDIIQLILPHAYLVGGIATLMTPGPLRVLSRRDANAYLMRNRPFHRWAERRLLKRMHAFVGNSRRVTDELLQEGAPVERVGLVYNGIDMDRYNQAFDRAAIRKALHIGEQTLVLVKVANLWPHKGHGDLLRALSGAAIPQDWVLLLAGRDEGMAALLRAQAKALGLDDEVTFLGEYAPIPRLLHAADIGLCASHKEGFSNAVLEYLGAGLAVVATDVGGNAEAIGEAGLVVPAQSPAELGDAIRALADPALRLRCSRLAKAQARRFSKQHCVDAYEHFYTGMLSTGDVPEALRAPTPAGAQT